MTFNPTQREVRAALLGYGRWGENVARNARRLDGCRLVAIADPSATRLDRAHRDHPGVIVEGDARRVIRDRAIDAILIATPASTHFDLALAALDAGKHVFVEKPLTTSLDDARTLVDRSARTGRVLMVDHTYLFSPAVRTLASALAAQAIGHPTSYESRRLNAGTALGDVPVHWDLAAHDLAILGHLFDGRPYEVSAFPLDGPPRVPTGGVRLRLRYPGSFTATIDTHWTAPAKTRLVKIAGAGGQIVYDDLLPEGKLRMRTASHEAVLPLLDATEPLFRALCHFVGCMAGREASLADARAGLDVVRILEAADRSLALGGRAVGLDPRAAAA